MFSQPCLKCLGGAVRQQVYRAASLQVDKDRSVFFSSSQREVVYTEHPHRSRRSPVAAPQVPQQSIGTGEQQSQALGHLGGSLATQAVDEQVQRLRKAPRLARIPICDRRHTFGEDAPRAARVVAEELACCEMEANWYALPGQIREHAFIVAVNPVSTLVALRTGNLLSAGAHAKDDNPVLGGDGFEGQGGGVRQHRRVR
jgi:hypothetical protein